MVAQTRAAVEIVERGVADDGDGMSMVLTEGETEARTLQAYEASRGTVVRVREGHWKNEFAGMRGTVQHCWGHSEHAAVDVLLDDGRLELFWLPDLSIVDEDIAV